MNTMASSLQEWVVVLAVARADVGGASREEQDHEDQKVSAVPSQKRQMEIAPGRQSSSIFKMFVRSSLKSPRSQPKHHTGPDRRFAGRTAMAPGRQSNSSELHLNDVRDVVRAEATELASE